MLNEVTLEGITLRVGMRIRIDKWWDTWSSHFSNIVPYSIIPRSEQKGYILTIKKINIRHDHFESWIDILGHDGCGWCIDRSHIRKNMFTILDENQEPIKETLTYQIY